MANGYQRADWPDMTFAQVCEACGAIVSAQQTEKHTAWHEQLADGLAPSED